MRRLPIIMAAAAGFAVAAPLPAVAQNATIDAESTEPARDDDDDDFPWGLLGLLGLAGLIPKKRETGIHVDARHNKP